MGRQLLRQYQRDEMTEDIVPILGVQVTPAFLGEGLDFRGVLQLLRAAAGPRPLSRRRHASTRATNAFQQ